MEHRLILGGEQYLPFARSCVTKLKKMGLPYANQSFEIDGVSIRVRIEPEHEYIRIEGGLVGYEFLAADAGYTELSNGDIGIEGATSALYPGSPFCTGSGVRYKATPVFSQSLTDPTVPPKWPLVTIDDVLTTGNLSGDIAPGTFYTFASRPNTSFQTRHWWHNNKPKQLVTSVCATGNGRTWVDRRGRLYSASMDVTYKIDAESKYGPARTSTKVTLSTETGVLSTAYSADGLGITRGYACLSAQPPFIYLKGSPITNYSNSYTVSSHTTAKIRAYFAEYDYSAAKRTIPALYYEGEEMFDVAPAYYTSDAIFIAGTQRTLQANWRHAAVCTGRDSDGNAYKFFVSTDTHGVFTFYPAKNYLAEGYEVRNIPAGLTKVVRVDYPTWVTVQPDNVSTTHDHWLWKFNKDATRACTTPLHQEDLYISVGVSDAPGPFGRRVAVILPIYFEGRATITLAGDFVPQKLRVFRVKYGSTYAPEPPSATFAYGYAASTMTYGVEYQGKIIPIGFSGVEMSVPDFNGYPGMDPLEMEPEKLTMPGFVEVDIAVAVVLDDAGAMADFFPTVTVIDSEQYDDNKTLFMDCDYYIKGSADTPAEEGDLLTAEIEVFCGGTQPTPSSYPPYTPVGNLEDIALGGLALTNVYVFHTIRRRSDRAVVARLALMRAGEFAFGGIYERNYVGAGVQAGSTSNDPYMNAECYYGVIEQADLRFMSFLTISYYRRAGLLPFPQITKAEAGLSGVPSDMVEDPKARARAYPHLLRPRFELRVGSDPVRTIDYSRPEVTGFIVDPDIADSTIPDPMTNSTLPVGVEDRSNVPEFKAAYLAIKHYFARHHIKITNNDTFSFNPDGSWSVYADRRSANLAPRAEAPDLVTEAMPLHPDSTEQSGVFDVVAPRFGKATSHKDMFNKAFDQTRYYSFYDQHTGDMGGFGRCGIWALK